MITTALLVILGALSLAAAVLQYAVLRDRRIVESSDRESRRKVRACAYLTVFAGVVYALGIGSTSIASGVFPPLYAVAMLALVDAWAAFEEISRAAEAPPA